MAKSAYIHIPFCKSKCKYCSFVSFTQYDENYVSLLLDEIDKYYSNEELNTLYFGGGTPSLLPVNDIEKIVSKFNLSKTCEITFEMNPDDAEIEYLKKLRNLGINRLSMGAQTFDNTVLKMIGRRHTSSQTINAVNLAREVGFENISLDLIYGLNSNIDHDLEEILKLNIPHISTYGLKIEEGSYFYKHLPQNLPDDNMQADMYLKINKKLEGAGYSRYEISNFSKQGFESKHNLTYWNNEEYYGFGVAAHGYIEGVRYSNPNSIKEYSKYRNEHTLTQEEKLEEEIFLGFRKTSGIDTNKIKEKFDIDFDKKYLSILKKFIPEYIEKTPQGYKLTLNGVLLSNIILAEFLV